MVYFEAIAFRIDRQLNRLNLPSNIYFSYSLTQTNSGAFKLKIDPVERMYVGFLFLVGQTQFLDSLISELGADMDFNP